MIVYLLKRIKKFIFIYNIYLSKFLYFLNNIKCIIKKIVPIAKKVGIKAWCKLIFLSNFNGITTQNTIKATKQGITVKIGIQTFSLKILYKDKQCKTQNNKTTNKIK